MKTLFVANRMPVPCTTGNRARILSLVRALAGWGHEIHYAFAGTDGVTAADVAELESHLAGGRFHRIEVRDVRQLESVAARALRRLLRLLKQEGGYRFPLDYGYDPRTTAALAALQERHAFAVVFVEYVFMSKALAAFPPRTLRVLDTHDAFGDRHKEFLKAGERPSWYATTPAEEETGFRRADVVIAIQEEEAARFRSRLGVDAGRVRTVGHIVDLSRRVELPDLPAAAFLGSVNAVNRAGLDYLIREIVPRVLRQQADFRLLVAGPISGGLAPSPGVEACGLVDHVANLFARAPLSLNPMLLGTGISIKLLDAMACGVPSVSTEVGARGLEPRFRRGIVTVPDRDPQAFSDALLQLLADRGQRRRLGELAYADASAWNEEQTRALSDIIVLMPRAR